MFRKIIFAQFSLFFLTSGTKATGGGRDSTAQFHQQKILIIPYEPRMHLSDADLDISGYSERSPQQVRSLFRAGITEKVNDKLQSAYPTHSLLQDLRPEALQELNRIYAAIDYSFDTSYAILHPKPDSNAASAKWNKNKMRKKELELRTATGDIKYMNVKVLDPELLSSLNKKYGTDLFVFLTQVEIKTTSKDCSDIQYGMYQRVFKVHYAVFGLDGKQRYGDVAMVNFPSNSNEIGEIMSKNFPALSDKISHGVLPN